MPISLTASLDGGRRDLKKTSPLDIASLIPKRGLNLALYASDHQVIELLSIGLLSVRDI